MTSLLLSLMVMTLRYDTMRHSRLTCAQKSWRGWPA